MPTARPASRHLRPGRNNHSRQKSTADSSAGQLTVLPGKEESICSFPLLCKPTPTVPGGFQKWDSKPECCVLSPRFPRFPVSLFPPPVISAWVCEVVLFIVKRRMMMQYLSIGVQGFWDRVPVVSFESVRHKYTREATIGEYLHHLQTS